MQRAFLSNRLEDLVLQLRDSLFSSPSLFTQRIVIVPSPLMKSWLMQYLAQKEHLGISMGMEVCYLQQALVKIMEWEEPSLAEMKPRSSPSLATLELLLYGHIQRIFSRYANLEVAQQRIWEPVARYIQLTPSSLTAISGFSKQRLIKLCGELASLFLQYGTYGQELLNSWQNEKIQGWQKQLWQWVYDQESSPWSYSIRELSEKMGNKIKDLSFDHPSFSKHKQVEVFGFNFLPSIHHQFFTSLSERIPVSYYLLSPCQGFWSDVCSDSTLEYLSSQVAHATLEEEDLHFTDRNALIANLGEIGKQMMRQLEATSVDVEEHFSLPESIADVPIYESFLHSDVSLHASRNPFSLLEALQADMICMRNPGSTQKLSFEMDSSIQVHFASSRRREVEIVHDLILNQIQKHRKDQNPLLPHEILVMAPDVMNYQSHIEGVFGTEESALDYQLFDLKSHVHQPLIREFWHILSLGKSRWEVLDVMALFDFSAFQKQFKISSEEVQQLYSWVQKADIRWGYNYEHRKSLFPLWADAESAGTWEEGLQCLLLGLFVPVPFDSLLVETSFSEIRALPMEAIQGSQAPLLGKWMHILRSLYEDLAPLRNENSLTLKEWMVFLKKLFEKYLYVDANTSENSAGQEKLLSLFKALGNLDIPFEKDSFHWEAVSHFLENELSRDFLNYRETHLHAVRFCSMLPMRAIPAKVIILMGMNEDLFPKKEKKNPLNLMIATKGNAFCPSPADYDRYLFLEALLSVRSTMIFTCSSMQHSPKGHAWMPSSVLKELLSYLDKGYLLNGHLPSIELVTEHPFEGSDRKYFEKESSLPPSFSKRRYLQSKALFQTKTAAGPLFPASDAASTAFVLQEETIVDIAQLNETVKQPIRLFCQRALGLYLEDKKGFRQKAEEDFIMPSFESYQLKKEALKTSLNHAWEWTHLKRKLPLGLFKDLLHAEVNTSVIDHQRILLGFSVHSHDIFSVEFHMDCIHPTQINEQEWRLPAFQFKLENGKEIKIVGRLEDLCSKGALVKGSSQMQDVFKNWPCVLLLNAILEKYPTFPLSPRLLFLKNGKEKDVQLSNAEKWMKLFLHYHFLSKTHLSWLLPEGISDVLEPNQEKFWKTIYQKIDSKSFMESDPYVKWACERELNESKKEVLFSACCENLKLFFNPEVLAQNPIFESNRV